MASEKPRKPGGKRTASDSPSRKPGFGKSAGPRSGDSEGKKPYRASGDGPSKPSRPAGRPAGKPGDRSGRKPSGPPRDRGYDRPGPDFNEFSEDSYRKLERPEGGSDRSGRPARDGKDRFTKRPSSFGSGRSERGADDRKPGRKKPADDFSTAPRRPTGYKSRFDKADEGKKPYGRKPGAGGDDAPKRSSRFGKEEGGDRSGFRGRSDRSSDRTPGGRSSERSDRGERSSFSDRKGSGYKGASDRGDRPERSDRPDRAARPDRGDRPDRSERSFDRSERPERADRGSDERKSYPKRDEGDADRPVKPYEAREAAPKRSDERPERKKASFGVSSERPAPKAKPRAEGDEPVFDKPKSTRFEKTGTKGKFEKGKKKVERDEPPTYNLRRFESKDNNGEEKIRLNRYIANSGVCSRREADELIAAGEIKVNGEVVTEMGYIVKPSDSVQYGKKILNREKMVYVLLNKPKGFITTTEDPEERRTVMELVEGATKERIFPVGRLDRNTTGLLLFTNDGELAQKLSHPSKITSKVYQVELDKPLTEEHFDEIKEGLELEDGKAEVDDLAILAPDRMALGIELHIGRNRIVRRIFEHLGYEVVKLDRVAYAGLTKKDLARGQWRFLDEKEVIRLKYFD